MTLSGPYSCNETCGNFCGPSPRPAFSRLILAVRLGRARSRPRCSSGTWRPPRRRRGCGSAGYQRTRRPRCAFGGARGSRRAGAHLTAAPSALPANGPRRSTARLLDAPIVIDDRLRERDFGIWEGLPIDECLAEIDPGWMTSTARWLEMPISGAEPVAAVVERTAALWRELVADPAVHRVCRARGLAARPCRGRPRHAARRCLGDPASSRGLGDPQPVGISTTLTRSPTRIVPGLRTPAFRARWPPRRR